MKITILGSGSSGGVPLIGNYWGECDPNNPKNVRTRVSVLVTLDNKKNILIDTSPDLRMQSISNNIKKIAPIKNHLKEINKKFDLMKCQNCLHRFISKFPSQDILNILYEKDSPLVFGGTEYELKQKKNFTV